MSHKTFFHISHEKVRQSEKTGWWWVSINHHRVFMVVCHICDKIRKFVKTCGFLKNF